MHIYSTDIPSAETNSSNANGIEEYNSEQESTIEPTITTCLLSDNRSTDATCLLINDRPTRGTCLVSSMFAKMDYGMERNYLGNSNLHSLTPVTIGESDEQLNKNLFFHRPILDPIPNKTIFYPSIRHFPPNHVGPVVATIDRSCETLSQDNRQNSTQDFISESPDTGFMSNWLVEHFGKMSGHVVYACFLILGLGTLLPWNFFITAESYWMYKFRNTTSAVTWQDAERTYLQNIYTPLQVSLSQIMNFLFLFINAIGSQFVAQKIRLFGALLIMITFFSITTAMVEINSDEWQLTFFSVTMIIIVIMNASTAIFQGGVYGVAGMFPLTYINALNIGQALGGVFASLARIISIYFGSDPVTSAFIFFLIADIVLLLTLFEYMYVSRTNFYKFYSTGGDVSEDVPKETSSFISLMKDHWRIFKEIWFLGVAVCFVFIVTLSVYPVMCVRIKSTYENKVWVDEYFQPVVTFFLFNICDYASRHLAEYTMWPRRGSRTIIILSFLRVIFIPLFLLCNHDANSNIPSVFKSDFWYMAFMIGFGLSNGYLVSLCMMYAPRMVAAHDSEKAGTMMAALIGLGLLVGASLSFLFALIS